MGYIKKWSVYLESFKNSEFWEQRKNEMFGKAWYNAKVGDTLPEDIIYQYVECLHRYPEDMYDGDLGQRIEQFTHYKLEELPVTDFDKDEWEVHDYLVAKYVEMDTSNYPPIVVDEDLCIIDGIHRLNAIIENGGDKILAWVGYDK